MKWYNVYDSDLIEFLTGKSANSMELFIDDRRGIARYRLDISYFQTVYKIDYSKIVHLFQE